VTCNNRSPGNARRTPDRLDLGRESLMHQLGPLIRQSAPMVSASGERSHSGRSTGAHLAKVDVEGSNPFSRSENSAGLGVRSTTCGEIRTPECHPHEAYCEGLATVWGGPWATSSTWARRGETAGRRETGTSHGRASGRHVAFGCDIADSPTLGRTALAISTGYPRSRSSPTLRAAR
jgi:hypothetical protein